MFHHLTEVPFPVFADHVTTIMLYELHPELAVTVGAYEKLVDVVGVDSTLAIFNRQVKTVREEDNQSKRQK